MKREWITETPRQTTERYRAMVEIEPEPIEYARPTAGWTPLYVMTGVLFVAVGILAVWVGVTS